ncbi:hypothetical protein MAR_018278 [Mya arenaria]|uniref:Sushi domain-containing protein n=1 Tax=Mya arenaria TaxID=6604 RepID=A0ABY7EGT0_MYAAR|nr:hypothetical protein MAR_018278 [Mya arenaria]
MKHERKCAVMLMCFCCLFHVVTVAAGLCKASDHQQYDPTECKCNGAPNTTNGNITVKDKNKANITCFEGYMHNGVSTAICTYINGNFNIWDPSVLNCTATTRTTTTKTRTTTTTTAATITTTTTPRPSVTMTGSTIKPSSTTNSTSNELSKTSTTTSFSPTSTNVSDISKMTKTTSLPSTSLTTLASTVTKTNATQTQQQQYSKGSFPTSGSAGIAIAVLIILVAFIVGLIVLRKHKQRGDKLFGKAHSDHLGNNIHSNAAYDPHAPSVDNESVTSKDSGLGKHDESGEEELLDGEYDTIVLHYPNVNQQIENTYNHMDGSPTADSTYSHIPSCKDALFDKTYSHMANGKPLKALELEDTDTTYNHLGDSSCSKHKYTKEETYNDTYNHTQINPGCPKTDPDDQDDNYSHINQQESNAGKQQADVQDSTNATTVYDKMNEFTKIAAERTKQYDESVNSSMTNAEGVNNAESHTYFVLESNDNQRPKQAPYDYAVVAMPEKDRTEFKVVDSPTDLTHEYFIIEPEFNVVEPPTDTPHEYFVIEPTTEL